MRKVQKVLTGIFLSGVLIGGMGTGIAMVEYSSLAYGGEKLIGEDSLVTKTLDYQFELDGRVLKVAGLYYWNREESQEIEIDDRVPAGTVRYEVTYNEKTVSPRLGFEPYEEEEEEEEVRDFEDGEWEEAGSDETEEDVSKDMDGDADRSVVREEEPVETDIQMSQETQAETSGQEEKKPGKIGYLYLTASYHDNGFAVLMENKDTILEELKQGKISSYDMAYITDVKIKVNPATVPYIEECYVIR